MYKHFEDCESVSDCENICIIIYIIILYILYIYIIYIQYIADNLGASSVYTLMRW